MSIASDFRKAVSLANTIKKKKIIEREAIEDQIEDLINDKAISVKNVFKRRLINELKEKRLALTLEIREMEEIDRKFLKKYVDKFPVKQ